MKKLLSVLLAILMAFSAVTVAFATDAEADATTTEAAVDEEATAPVEGEEGEEGEQDFGDLQWILDLPFWTVGPAFKFAKIAFKLVNAYLKVAKIFGIVDKDMGDMLVDIISDMIKNSQNGEEAPEESTTVAPVVTTTAAA